MPEAAAAAVSWLTAGEVVLTAAEAYAIATAVELVAATAYNNYAKRRAREKMREAHNASLRDRYAMARGGITQRRIVLGRQRVSGTISFIKSYGPLKEKLVTILPIAAEEIDAVEAIYFDDEQVVLDGTGGVLGVNRRELFTISSTGATFTLQDLPASGTVTATARYGSTDTPLTVSGVVGKDVTVSGASGSLTGQVTIAYQPAYSPFAQSPIDASGTITTDGAGNGSVTLPNTPIAGSVSVVTAGNATIDSRTVDVTAFASVAGNVVTLTGAPTTDGTSFIVQYRYLSAFKAKIRTYLGAPGQVADAALIAALPGIWTAAHVGNSIAYIIMEADYDPDAFHSSIPNISAQVRGSKVYDPRTGITAWSENPALLARHVATHPIGGRLPTAQINDASFIAAANVCDTVVNYVMGGRTYTRPRYTAGLVLSSGQRADDVLQDLCEAMGGERAFVDGQLRVKAGAWTTPLQTLDETWLIREGGSVQSQRRRPMEELANITTGVFADQENDYQIRDFPPVRSALYIAEDGVELPDDVELNGVTFSPQAQQIAAQRMRRKRFGRRISVTCNMRAYGVEWGDVLYVNLPTRFGFVNLPCEVLDVSFTIDGGIALALEEVGPEIYTIASSFSEVPLPPNVFSPNPVLLPPLTGLAVSSADAVQVRNADGTVVQRMRVSWTAAPDQSALANGGGVEVRYGVASWPESQWLRQVVEGAATRVDLPGVQQGQLYLVKARYFNALVNGPWSQPVLHSVGSRSIQVGTGGIVPEAATKVNVATASSVSVAGYNRSYNPAGPIVFPIANTWTTVVSITFTPVVSCEVEITATGTIAITPGSSSGVFEKVVCNYSVAFTKDGGAETAKASQSQLGQAGSTDRFPVSYSKRVAVTGGVSTTIAIRMQKGWLDDTTVLDDIELRLVAIYR